MSLEAGGQSYKHPTIIIYQMCKSDLVVSTTLA